MELRREGNREYLLLGGRVAAARIGARVLVNVAALSPPAAAIAAYRLGLKMENCLWIDVRSSVKRIVRPDGETVVDDLAIIQWLGGEPFVSINLERPEDSLRRATPSSAIECAVGADRCIALIGEGGSHAALIVSSPKGGHLVARGLTMTTPGVYTSDAEHRLFLAPSEWEAAAAASSTVRHFEIYRTGTVAHGSVRRFSEAMVASPYVTSFAGGGGVAVFADGTAILVVEPDVPRVGQRRHLRTPSVGAAVVREASDYSVVEILSGDEVATPGIVKAAVALAAADYSIVAGGSARLGFFVTFGEHAAVGGIDGVVIGSPDEVEDMLAEAVGGGLVDREAAAAILTARAR